MFGRMFGAKGARCGRLVAMLVAMLTLSTLVSPAFAQAAALVNLRVEGRYATLWQGPVWVGNSHTVVDDVGGSHATTVTVLGALDDAARMNAFPYTVHDYGTSLFVTSVNGEYGDPNPPWPGWMYWVNNVPGTVGADQYSLKNGDSLLWAYGESWDASPIVARLSSGNIAINTTLTVAARQLSPTGVASALPEARVSIGSSVMTANALGVVQRKMIRAGVYGVRASKAGYVRSALTTVKVGIPSAIRYFDGHPGTVRYGSYAKLAGRLVSGGAGLQGRRLAIQKRSNSRGGWTVLRSVVTGRGGIFAAWIRPARTAEYRVVWGGDSRRLGCASGPELVRVVP